MRDELPNINHACRLSASVRFSANFSGKPLPLSGDNGSIKGPQIATMWTPDGSSASGGAWTGGGGGGGGDGGGSGKGGGFKPYSSGPGGPANSATSLKVGGAEEAEYDLTGQTGSHLYMAPEVFLGHHYNHKVRQLCDEAPEVFLAKPKTPSGPLDRCTVAHSSHAAKTAAIMF